MKSCCSRCIRRLPLTSQITHSGLCGTDIHYFEYGQVLGHEGVGIVLDIGKNVPENLFSRGDILGFGIQLNVSPPASPLTIVTYDIVLRCMFSLLGRTRNLLS